MFTGKILKVSLRARSPFANQQEIHSASFRLVSFRFDLIRFDSIYDISQLALNNVAQLIIAMKRVE